MTDFPHWSIEDEFENPEFWKRAYNRAMKLSIEMTAERDEARRWARFFMQEMNEYKQDYQNAAFDWADECDKVDEARRIARRLLNDREYRWRCQLKAGRAIN